MKKRLNGLNITYRFHQGKTETVNLILHGWGGNLNSFRFLENFLIQKDYSVLTLDFPGFGGSEMPRDDFTLDDYFKIVDELLEANGIKKVNIIAHSFGGRVALLFAFNKPQKLNKLVLVDSAGLKPKFSLTRSIKILHYKFLKMLKSKGLIKRDLTNFGSADYKAMPEGLKPVFNRIVNTDLTYTLKTISSPTLIVWGKDDEATPYYMAKKLNKNIKDSAIITLDGGHFAYLQNSNKFLLVLENFLRENIDGNT